MKSSFHSASPKKYLAAEFQENRFIVVIYIQGVFFIFKLIYYALHTLDQKIQKRLATLLIIMITRIYKAKKGVISEDFSQIVSLTEL